MRFVFHTLLLVLLTAPAFAGTLFPPTNSAKNAAGIYACADKSALVWSTDSGGSLKCIDTSSMVTIAACPTGQVLTGITNGVPTCAAAAAAASPLTVSCPSGQVLSGISGGAAVCTTPSGGGASSITVSCPAGRVLTGISAGSPVCTASPPLSFGGTFYGYAGISEAGMDGWTCAGANVYTGDCSCPSGYTAFATTNGMGHSSFICFK